MRLSATVERPPAVKRRTGRFRQRSHQRLRRASRISAAAVVHEIHQILFRNPLATVLAEAVLGADNLKPLDSPDAKLPRHGETALMAMPIGGYFEVGSSNSRLKS